MDSTTNNPAETTRLLNEIDLAFAGIDLLAADEVDYTEVIWIEEIKEWLLQEPAIELPYDDAPEGIGGDHPTTNDTTHRPYTCTCCGLDTDEVGPLCPIGGRWYGMCEECYADNRADEDFAEQGGYD